MFGWFSEASTFASRSKRASRSGSCVNASGNTFSATSRIELRVPRSIHIPHAVFADLGGDLIGAEGGAGTERHLLIVVRAEVAALVARLPTAQRQDQRPPIAWVPPQTRRPR